MAHDADAINAALEANLTALRRQRARRAWLEGKPLPNDPVVRCEPIERARSLTEIPDGEYGS